MVDWFNSRRLLEPIFPVQGRGTSHVTISRSPGLALTNALSQEPGAIHVAF